MSVRVVATAALLMAACSGASVAGPSTPASPSTVPSTARESPTTSPTTTSTPSTDDETEPAAPPTSTATEDDVLELFEALGVDRLLVADGTDYIAVADGVATRKPDAQAWTDGRFLYWDESSYDEGTGINSFVRSVAATFDWNVVCEFDEWDIHHVTERPDGSLVAGVERPWDWDGQELGVGEGERVEVPAYAAECTDGSSQPIASFRGYGGDSEWWGVERAAGRVFTYDGDAEGNANYFNEDGVLLNGDDIVGSMLFNRDGSDAVYQIYVGGWAAAPALSVRKVNTTTGEIDWTREFETPISSLDYSGERVFVGLVPEGEEWLGYDYSTDRVLVLEGRNGEVIDEVPTSLWLHYAG